MEVRMLIYGRDSIVDHERLRATLGAMSPTE
jgi:hypothetical protein